MKLYYSTSVCSLAVRIILHELGLNSEFEAVNLKTKITETGEDYLTINPKGAVLFLRINANESLTENAIILQYLADNYGTHLLPSLGNIQRYRTLEWLNFISTDLHRYCAPLFWSKIPEEVKQILFLPRFNEKLLIAEKHLVNSKYLMGDKFTIADSYLFVILIWIKKLKMNLKEWPNLYRYFLDLSQFKSIQKSLVEENLFEFIA